VYEAGDKETIISLNRPSKEFYQVFSAGITTASIFIAHAYALRCGYAFLQWGNRCLLREKPSWSLD
jgi:hypothetical protein